jgi:hypothetical protein
MKCSWGCGARLMGHRCAYSRCARTGRQASTRWTENEGPPNPSAAVHRGRRMRCGWRLRRQTPCPKPTASERRGPGGGT